MNPIERIIIEAEIPEGLQNGKEILRLLNKLERFRKAGKRNTKLFRQKILNYWGSRENFKKKKEKEIEPGTDWRLTLFIFVLFCIFIWIKT